LMQRRDCLWRGSLDKEGCTKERPLRDLVWSARGEGKRKKVGGELAITIPEPREALFRILGVKKKQKNTPMRQWDALSQGGNGTNMRQARRWEDEAREGTVSTKSLKGHRERVGMSGGIEASWQGCRGLERRRRKKDKSGLDESRPSSSFLKREL